MDRKDGGDRMKSLVTMAHAGHGDSLRLGESGPGPWMVSVSGPREDGIKRKQRAGRPSRARG